VKGAAIGALLVIAACGGGAAHAKRKRIKKVKLPLPAYAVSELGPSSARPDGTTPVGAGDLVGTAHPFLIEAMARDGAWIIVCQPRVDTDHNHKIAIEVGGFHGEMSGDDLLPYLVRGAGDGEPIDSLVGYTRNGHWLVVVRAGKLELFDGRTGAWSELVGADLRDDGVPIGPPRIASIASDGDRMTYFRDDETLVIRELSSGRERTVTVPGVRLWRVEVEPLGHWAHVYAMRTDSNKDGTITWPTVDTTLSARGCRGPVRSSSTRGLEGDEPQDLWIELAKGTIHAARNPRAPAEADVVYPQLGTFDGKTVLAVDAAGRRLIIPDWRDDGIPNGPLRWVALR
jgi:hypothetical protein